MQDIRTQVANIHHTKRLKDKTVDEYFESFLKENLTKLWPAGWMKVESMKKECFKDLVQKPKENKKPPSSIPTPIPTQNPVSKERKSSSVNNNNFVRTTNDATSTSSTQKAQIKTEKSDAGSNALPAFSDVLPLSTGDLIDGSNRFEKLADSAYISKQKASTNGMTEHSSPTKRSSDHSINHIMSSSTANSIEISSKRKEEVVIISDSPIAARDNSDDDCLIVETASTVKQKAILDKYNVKKKIKGSGSDRDPLADDEDITNLKSTLNELKELQVSEKTRFFISFIFPFVFVNFFLLFHQFFFNRVANAK